MENKVAPKITHIGLDWKEQIGLDELREALSPLGVHVYEDPSYDGQDSYGFIFSNVELSEEEILESGEGSLL